MMQKSSIIWMYIAGLKVIDRTMSITKFSEKLNVNRSYLSRIINYKQPVSMDIAQRIETLSKGEIDAWELMKESKEKIQQQQKKKRHGTKITNKNKSRRPI